MHELILGGQRSGKSRCAEARASAWLGGQAGRSAVLIATAQAADAEMRERIERHRADRAARVPDLATVEVPLELARAVRTQAQPSRLVVVDCLTLWLTNLLMPSEPSRAFDDAACTRAIGDLLEALRTAGGPVVLVSNEIGLGVTPMGADVRRFVDELGRLHQAIAALCSDVTWMVAGLEQAVKRGGR